MKGKIVTLVLLFLASLLFPYTMTILCFDTGLMSYQPEDLYSVVLENEIQFQQNSILLAF